MTDEILIRRAGRQDVLAIATLVETATGSKRTVDEAEVMDWLFGKGLIVAVDAGALVGVAAWQAENLLSVTDVFHLSPERQHELDGAQLLAAIEAEAGILMCEANVVLVPAWMPVTVKDLLEQAGYEPREYADLHRIWREVLADWMDDEPELRVKQLRDRMVMVPI